MTSGEGEFSKGLACDIVVLSPVQAASLARAKRLEQFALQRNYLHSW